MPWPEKQRRAIFLDVKRRRGERAARELMRKHRQAAIAKQLKR